MRTFPALGFTLGFEYHLDLIYEVGVLIVQTTGHRENRPVHCITEGEQSQRLWHRSNGAAAAVKLSRLLC